jgi:hypothetical protein
MADADVRLVLDPQKVAEVLRGPNGPVVRRLIEDGELVKQEAQRLVGVHKPDPWGRPKDRRPGTLRDSIVKRFVTQGNNVSVEVGSADPIALIHHEGTQPHPIYPRAAPRLVFWKGGTVIYAKQVSHPGTRPNRFLVNALQVLRGRY